MTYPLSPHYLKGLLEHLERSRPTGIKAMIESMQRAEAERRLLLHAATSPLNLAIQNAARLAQSYFGRDSAAELRDTMRHAQERMQASIDSILRAAVQASEAQRQIGRFLTPLGQTPWSELVDRLHRDQERLRQGLLETIAPWRSVFEPLALDELITAIEEEPPSETNIEQLVTEAVAKTFAAERRRTDWQFVIQLVIAILMYLAQALSAGGLDPAAQEQFDTIQAQLREQKLIQEALATRSILRRARLFAGPNRHRAVLMVLPPGASVVVLERRSKWTRVRILARDDGDQRLAGSGWVLNKYLSRAP